MGGASSQQASHDRKFDVIDGATTMLFVFRVGRRVRLRLVVVRIRFVPSRFR
jgi:hypothetical protein